MKKKLKGEQVVLHCWSCDVRGNLYHRQDNKNGANPPFLFLVSTVGKMLK